MTIISGNITSQGSQFNRFIARGDTILFYSAIYIEPDGTVFTVPVTVPKIMIPDNAVAYDLTNNRIIFTLKKSITDQDNQAVAQVDNKLLGGITVLFPLLGSFSVLVQPSKTTALPNNPTTPLAFDIKIIDPGGKVSTVETGTFTVVQNCTQIFA